LTRWKLFAAIAFLAVAAVHFAAVPRSIWEFDESLFAAAVERYEPLRHHPPPPGYPLYIGFAKLVALVTPDAFTALLATSVIALLAGFCIFVIAFRAIASGAPASRRLDRRRPAPPPEEGRRDAARPAGGDAGVPAALLLYLSPALLISGTLPQSDAGALALLGLAIWGCTRERAWLCGMLCAIAIGWRLQLAVAVVPMFLAAVVMMRTWRDRLVAIGAFGVACLAWFVPLVIEAGGPASYWNWLSGQARYYAHHDADLSRSGYSPAQIALRFIAHPWGPKWLSLPLLVLALLGVGRNRRLIPLACGSLAYLAFALATMDPADAVRYAIPALPLFALLAASWSAGVSPAEQAASSPPSGTGAGRSRISRRDAGVPLVILYAVGAIWYAWPVLHARATSLAPPTAAVAWIKANVSRDTIVLYDAALWPHASYLLRDRKTTRVEPADASIPMVILADGERGTAPGVTFRWPDTDAYRKLTREHYGAVSVIPVAATERFRVVEGAYARERTRDGRAWRWLGARAILELPDLGAKAARVVLRTPSEYPLDGNRVRINDAVVDLKRDSTAEAIVPIVDGRITITAERTFIPAQIRGANNRDARTLSVMLVSVEQLDPRPTSGPSPRPR
jgi:hypothetical protein